MDKKDIILLLILSYIFLLVNYLKKGINVYLIFEIRYKDNDIHSKYDC